MFINYFQFENWWESADINHDDVRITGQGDKASYLYKLVRDTKQKEYKHNMLFLYLNNCLEQLKGNNWKKYSLKRAFIWYLYHFRMVKSICNLCNNYETDIKHNMIRHVKFTCPKRSHLKLHEDVRRSKRGEAKVKVSVSP